MQSQLRQGWSKAILTEQPTILYIEDNTDNQRLVQRVLGARGYQVRIAPDGVTGLALASEMLPVLILVDINIPGLDGYEVTTRLRSMVHLNMVPIVALTADVSPGARERALVAGCDGYLSKPIEPRRLPELVAEFVGGKRELVSPTVETQVLREYNQKVVEHLEQRVRELMRVNAELQEVDRLKNQFLSSFSHELRTPLTSLVGYINLLSRGTLGDLNEEQQQAIEVLERNCDTLSRQINNLVYLQEYRASQLKLIPLSLRERLLNLAVEAKTKAERSGLTFVLEADDEAQIQADMLAVDLAVINLLDNAVKFTPPGGQVTVTLRNEPTRVILRVEDTGMGIPAEAHEKIFLPFYRVDSSLSGSGQGNGIGLTLVQHIAEAHGGQVNMRSVPGQGSVFTLVLPRHQAE